MMMMPLFQHRVEPGPRGGGAAAPYGVVVFSSSVPPRREQDAEEKRERREAPRLAPFVAVSSVSSETR